MSPPPFIVLNRCRFEAPFLPETFPEYTGHYPLFRANEAILRARETRHEDITSTATTAATATARGGEGGGADRKHNAENSGRLSKSEDGSSEPVPTLSTRPPCGEGKKTTKVEPSKPKQAKIISDTAAASAVGSLNLRICVTTSTSIPPPSRVARIARGSETANSAAAIGDEDTPDVKRRSKKNAVIRRVRLRVRWVSLARLLHREIPSGSSFSGGAELNTPVVEDTTTTTTTTAAATKQTKKKKTKSAQNGPESHRRGVGVGGRSSHDRGPDREKDKSAATGASPTTTLKNRSGVSQDRGPDRDNRSTAGESTTSRKRSSSSSSSDTANVDDHSPVRRRLLPLLPTRSRAMGVVSCRVTWCGVPVDSFEICPRTGLPLTPGECLLSLPRGTLWRNCWLVLEMVISTEGNFTRHHPATIMRQAQDRLDDARSTRVQSDACEKARDLGARRESGGASVVSTGESGDGRRQRHLGMVVVGWQVRRAMIDCLSWSQRNDFLGGGSEACWRGSNQRCGRVVYPHFHGKGCTPILPVGVHPHFHDRLYTPFLPVVGVPPPHFPVEGIPLFSR